MRTAVLPLASDDRWLLSGWRLEVGHGYRRLESELMGAWMEYRLGRQSVFGTCPWKRGGASRSKSEHVPGKRGSRCCVVPRRRSLQDSVQQRRMKSLVLLHRSMGHWLGE